MFLFSRPSPSEIDSFISIQREKEFSYAEVGATRGSIPPDYVVDHNRERLGHGGNVFARGCQALTEWQMFKLGWVELFRADSKIEVGTTVAILVRHFGFWSLNASRIVYVIKETRLFGFAYGTLTVHAEQGEERFSIEWSPDDDSVIYDILAFSRPRQARMAQPVSRMLQKQFARDSKNAMRHAVSPVDNCHL